MTETVRKIDPAKVERIAEVLKTIAHPIRLLVVEALSIHGTLTVSELVAYADAEQSLVSHHLTKMRDKGILICEREGKNIKYSLADTHISAIFDCMENCDLI